MEKGYLALLLHAHLPFIRHPEYEEFLEEDWLFEAITETYIPLVDVYDGLLEDNVDFRITMSITPPLCEMFVDPLLQSRYLRHLDKLIALANEEVHRTRPHSMDRQGVSSSRRGTDSTYHHAALMYAERFTRARYVFEEKYHRNLVFAFKKFQDLGKLEVITCAATHPFLPFLVTPEAIRAQIAVAKTNYTKHFGRPPRGIWLAECAYFPGLDRQLKDLGIRYFFVDSHGLVCGNPRPVYDVFAPVYCPSGVAAFARDIESSKQVWSSEEGYPGDYNYREFYRDLGHDGHYDYIRPYLHEDGIRRNLGIKYHKITGEVDLGQKKPYDPRAAWEKAAEHAGNFMFNRQLQVRWLHGQMGKKPIVISPYDAELFGHWWFEGPDFLNAMLRKTAEGQDDIRLITPSEYLRENQVHQVVTPCYSSWGDKGYAEVWLNGTNDWIYRHLHASERRMVKLANDHPNATGLLRRALNQAARELMLAQSSDWAFIMTTGTTVPYAEKRTRDHLHRFNGIYLQIIENRLEETWIADLEWKDSIFYEMDYRVYRSGG
ncbi:MAG: glycoside hydrolase [Planctomycetes bacterium DG_58]|nr:MAG: glycoside hydrolase [Planctomycetes bacterium DG_58]